VELAIKPVVTNLLTEYLENPLGIDVQEPRFSWCLQSGRRGAYQTAYQIQVADSLEALVSGRPNVWDSGRVASSNCTNVALPSRNLASGVRYWWRVKVWDEAGRESDFSEPAWFEMGLLNREDWEGTWIAAPLAGHGYHSLFGESELTQKWVQVDLGEAKEFSSVKIYPARAGYWPSGIEKGFGWPHRFKIEASNDPDFKQAILLVDRTDKDGTNQDEKPVEFSFKAVKARYVRFTATKLSKQADGKKLLALGEIQVLDSSGANLALNKPVQALDSFEGRGWSVKHLTDGQTSAGAPQGIAPLFRREFQLSKPVKQARAYVTGLGYYELYLNGRKVGDRVLDPPYTSFERRVFYSTYDVTDLLKEGQNAVGAIVGKGWYTGKPCLLLQMNIDHEDGTRTSVTTSSDWKYSWGPILENSLYHGETYDARLEQPGWSEPEFDDSKWQKVEVVAAPTKELSAQMIQPIKVIEDIRPKNITNPMPGIWVFDFGQNFSGWCRLKVSGPAGTEVVLKHAELLYPNGTVNQENLRSARATDRYILKGEGVETWEPRFTYHGFRYVQVEGFPGQPDLESLTGRVVHTSFERKGTFECSNGLINQIQSNSVWGFRTNFHSIPTDCPQRDERQGWMGDAHVSADAAFYNFDIAPAYAKFLRDIQDVQGPNGEIPDTVPYVWGSNPGDPMWAAAYHFITWDMYRHTGDRRLLAMHYDNLKAYADLLIREAGEEYVIKRNCYGDWLSVEDTPRDLISTGGFYRCVWLTARMAEVLGRCSDVEKYDSVCSKIAEAFNNRFFNPETNMYGNGSQFSQVWPLYLGIVPADRRKAVAENLVKNIMEKHKGHLSTGFLGTRYLLDVLCNEGYPDVAYTIVSQKDYPSWGFMIMHGATTIWEWWELKTGRGMNSHNHPAFGAVSGWFYRMLAGIVPDSNYAGYERFDIKPFVPSGLDEVRAVVDTVRGRVISNWQRKNSGLVLSVSIPTNSKAFVWVPKVGIDNAVVYEGEAVVWKDGKFVPGVEGLTGAEDSGEWIRFEAGAGSYKFEVADSH
jgi:alpha-L-rhamnosidase